MTVQQKIGLIAGSGKFPFLFAKAAKAKGFCVLAIAITGNADPRLKNFVDGIKWFKISEFRKIFEFLKNVHIESVIMAGQIQPRTLFHKEIFRDEDLRKLIVDLEDRRADSIFGAIAQKILESGIKILDSTMFLEDYLPKKGVLTAEELPKEVWDDINFGFRIAKEIARLDIGQTVVVKNKAIVAVESMEGTDATIRRAGTIASRGCVVVKVSKPNQDMRFDIPVIGLQTIDNLVKIKAKCLAFEAKKTLLIDKEKCIKKAKKHNLAIVAI
ncbi:MAG: UDP-2,3-diacylglucosamine diphosphatase LpxI [Candidatus Omnitrophica bacterium]|nr:UDP-2,3-diacylglucosamine diphosphatase LpxI [Candidatus Omnitrophota bacterium]MDD5352859.1 UDP-2,3-diacylglucosamine diphosphatase LpxI [Candidatus Omnitrophota bacterium]MDD5550458.1 UDP-2,3-diacylglucosamine diphosphatase LpxI [Candidatus Omnitrophota bacterium]